VRLDRYLIGFKTKKKDTFLYCFWTANKEFKALMKQCDIAIISVSLKKDKIECR